MVCIIELIKKLKNDLLCRINLDLALYNYCNNKSIVQLPYNNNLALTIAFRGYNKEIEKNFNIDTIDSHQKQNNFKDKFAQCIGIRLFTCAEETILLEDFERFDLKQKYIMTKIFPSLKKHLEKILIMENNPIAKFISLLINIDKNNNHKEVEFDYLQENNSDIVDLIILEDYVKAYGLLNYKKQNEKDFIVEILNNFSNSIKWITSNRSCNKTQFEIKDEYDVQDVLCTIIQSIFSDCEKEDPLQKDSQGLSHRIDLVIHSLGIYIEVKMIKAKDKKNIKSFKKQIDEDIVGYSSNKDLKHLIFFTYDPNGFADNEMHFKGSQDQVTNNGITYSIDKVYQK